MKVLVAVTTMAFLMWFCIGLIDGLRKRAAERFAQWALPAGQAITFRLAILIARLARWIAPYREELVVSYIVFTDLNVGFLYEYKGRGEISRVLVMKSQIRSRLTWIRNDSAVGIAVTKPRLRFVPWTAPDAAIAELEQDLVAERRVVQPVRLVLPLLGQAILFRLTGNTGRVQRVRLRLELLRGDRQVVSAATKAFRRSSFS